MAGKTKASLKPVETTDNLYPVHQSDLDAAIAEGVYDSARVVLMPPSRLYALAQPRTEFEEPFIVELAHGIYDLRERGLGIKGSGFIHPVKARLPEGAIKHNGVLKDTAINFPITAGETRWRAAQVLARHGIDVDSPEGKQHVTVPDILLPVIIEDISTDDAYELAFLENFMRRGLPPMDQAVGLRITMNKQGLSYRAAAQRFLGNSSKFPTIQNILSPLNLDVDLQELLGTSKNSYTILARIQPIKDAQVRAELINMVRAGATGDEIHNRIRAYKRKAAPSRSSNSQGSKTATSSPPQRQRFGSPAPKGSRGVAPKFDVGTALQSIIRQADAVRDAVAGSDLDTNARRQYREQAVAALEALEAVRLQLGGRAHP